MGAFVPDAFALPFLQGAADRIGVPVEVTNENREQVEEILSEPNRELTFKFTLTDEGVQVMNKYIKKPVVIEAIQYTGDNGAEVGLFVGYADRNENNQFVISTLEGKMLADVGDFIIKGVQGEFYPCKPDIFEQTYDAVTE